MTENGTSRTPTIMHDKPKLKVYYNSACPVCKAGIEAQMQKESTCDIQWYDIHQNNRLINEIGATPEFARKRLHAIDEQGDLQIGFDAFLAIWRNSAKETWKYRALGLPVVKQLCSFAYNSFATVLYRWNKSKKHW